MSNFKKLSTYVDVPCEWVSSSVPRNYKLDQLKAENAKLRELVRYMWDFSCVVPDEPHTSKEELDYSVEVCKRMRELGVIE